jgi:hypothetical protein
VFTPPNLEDYYTLFKLKNYFVIFWCILISQSVVIILVKYLKSKQFKKLAWFDKIFHSMECSNFAYPMHDWDHEDGDCHVHHSRMVETRKEVQLNILINIFFNLVLLFPLYVLCKCSWSLEGKIPFPDGTLINHRGIKKKSYLSSFRQNPILRHPGQTKISSWYTTGRFLFVPKQKPPGGV